MFGLRCSLPSLRRARRLGSRRVPRPARPRRRRACQGRPLAARAWARGVCETRAERPESMTRPLYALGRWAGRHNRIVILVWVVVALAVALAARSVGDQTNDNLSMPGTDSTRATTLLESRLP